MDVCLIIGIIKGLVLMIIGIAGLINIEIIANIYVAVLVVVIGLLVLGAAFNHRENKKWLNKIKKPPKKSKWQ